MSRHQSYRVDATFVAGKQNAEGIFNSRGSTGWKDASATARRRNDAARRGRWLAMAAVILGAYSVCPAAAQPTEPRGSSRSHWPFDEIRTGQTLDVVHHVGATVSGTYQLVAGVHGNALRFDGRTTGVRCPADKTTHLAGAFTVDAWIAIRAYPWNRCAIVAQRGERAAGFSLALDQLGRLLFQAAVNGHWQECVAQQRLTLYRWHHVAGVWDPAAGMRLFLDGRQVAARNISGKLETAKGTSLQIGKPWVPLPPADECRPEYGTPFQYSFDGLIDEVRIYDVALGEEQLAAYLKGIGPIPDSVLKPVRMPSGPAGAGLFGAYYTKLRYRDDWDAHWRGHSPDVVVRFDSSAMRIVFWRGVSYAPCLVTECGNWFCNEFMERSGRATGLSGCVESMSDKQARYSNVKILENSDARAVVLWRYAPVDKFYRIPYEDPMTGWGDWAEETYTIYPDGVAVRKVVMWSTTFQNSVQRKAKAWLEWSQSLPIMHPGQKPEDVLDRKRVLSLATMDGRRLNCSWPPTKYAQIPLPDANIQVAYLRSTWNPFLVMWPQEARIILWRGEPSKYSTFSWWNHWPVAQVPSGGRYATASDRPAHSCVSTQQSKPLSFAKQQETYAMLCGLTNRDAGDLVPLARSWAQAPAMKLNTRRVRNLGYDVTQRAYRLELAFGAEPESIDFEIQASGQSPLLNPAFIIRGWGERSARVFLDDDELKQGKEFRSGHRRQIERTDLVLWMQRESSAPIRVSIHPKTAR